MARRPQDAAAKDPTKVRGHRAAQDVDVAPAAAPAEAVAVVEPAPVVATATAVEPDDLAAAFDNPKVETPPAAAVEAVPAKGYDTSWIKSMTEPDTHGAIDIKLVVTEPPVKRPGEWRDTDNDGLTDAQEAMLGTDPLSDADADSDGVPDAIEVSQGMNPFDADSDHDTIPDGIEYERGFGAALIPAADPAKATDADIDGDGFSNDTEDMYGMNKSIPEAQLPGNAARMAENFAVRKTGEPLHDALLAGDLQQQITPAEEAKVLDAVFEGMTSTDVLSRYHTDAVLNALDGTAISPELQAQMDQFAKNQNDALLNRDVGAFIEAQNARGIPVTEESIKAFLNPTTTDLLSAARELALAGNGEAIEGSALGAALDAVLRTESTTPSTSSMPLPGQVFAGGSTTTPSTGTTTSTGSTATDAPSVTNQAEGMLDRMSTITSTPGSGLGAATGATTDAPPATTPAVDAADAAPVAPSAVASTTFTPDNTPTRVADNLANWADGVAGKLGASGSGGDGSAPGANTGTNKGPTTSGAATVDVDGDFGGTGVTHEGVTEEGRAYTETDLGDGNYSREYHDTHTQQIFWSDGTNTGEISLETGSDPGSDTSGDDTNPNAGTTDDDDEGTLPEDEEAGTEDDGQATARVNPDADVIALPATLSPIVAQIVSTGTNPTTTTPSGPYVDDVVAPIAVSNAAVPLGFNVGPAPGVIDGNPDFEVISGSPPGFDPTDPDTIDPDDPLVGSGGEDIDPGNFTPRPSNALMGAVEETGIHFVSGDSAPHTSSLGRGIVVDADVAGAGDGEPDDLDPFGMDWS